MRKAALKPVWKRKFIHTTHSRHDLPGPPTCLTGSSIQSHRLTLRTRGYYVYQHWHWVALSGDQRNGSVRPPDHRLGNGPQTCSATLVCDALSMAIQQRQPVSGLIVHSDQGGQYASELYLQNLLNKHGFICSMSRKGKLLILPSPSDSS
ncbi:MAG: hypothetical protein HS120_01190 [Burkholderiales bacterium]|nr:hypothetical protein [Burkholderiales bacterium]